jgi:hypothetical protein
VILSVHAEKTFDKIQHPFMIKCSEETRNRRMFLNITEAIDDRPIANIILTGEQLKPFMLHSGIRQACPLSPFLFNMLLDFIVRAIDKSKKLKVFKYGRKNSNCPYLQMK